LRIGHVGRFGDTDNGVSVEDRVAGVPKPEEELTLAVSVAVAATPVVSAKLERTVECANPGEALAECLEHRLLVTATARGLHLVDGGLSRNTQPLLTGHQEHIHAPREYAEPLPSIA
jgi:hypothetical protein